MNSPDNTPFLFISHRGTDKLRIAPVIGRLLADGICVFIDRTERLEQFQDHIQAGRLRRITGGANYEDAISTAIADSVCVVGFLSEGTIGAEGAFAREEMKKATETGDDGKLVPVQLDAGVMDRLKSTGNMGDRFLSYRQAPLFRDEHFDHDYGQIAEAIFERSKGQIVFGFAHAARRLADRQAAAAERLRGDRQSVVKDVVDRRNRRHRCRLVPWDSDGAYFWMTETPIGAMFASPQSACDALADLDEFRLPTEAELKRALAPMGQRPEGANPFGFATSLSKGAWGTRDGAIVIVGDRAGGPAVLHLVCKR